MDFEESDHLIFWKKSFEIFLWYVFDQVYFLEPFTAFRDLKEKKLNI